MKKRKTENSNSQTPIPKSIFPKIIFFFLTQLPTKTKSKLHKTNNSKCGKKSKTKSEKIPKTKTQKRRLKIQNLKNPETMKN
jgi:hypothetical protein